MEGLTLPCPRCSPTAAVDVTGSVVRCAGCGFERPFTRLPLYLVTGPPAAGKSSVVPLLAGRLPGTAVFDTDLFGPLSNPDWAAWASGWLLVAHGLAQSRISAVLCGYGISKSRVTHLPATVLLGPIRSLNLDLAADTLRQRLRGRPGYDEARVERKVVAAGELRQEADENINVTDLAEAEVAARIVGWLERELRATTGNVA